MARVREAMQTSRLEAFSDGVFAIAITLLVLDLRVPELGGSGGLRSALGHEWPQFAAYLTSFLVIGTMWVNHHSMFRQIRYADRGLLFVNLSLLLWTTLLPFTTKLMAHYLRGAGSNSHTAAAVYSSDLLLCGVSFSLLWAHALRARLVPHQMSPAEQRQSILRFSVGTYIYGATVALAFVSAPITLALQFAINLYYCFEQVRARPSDPELTSDDGGSEPA